VTNTFTEPGLFEIDAPPAVPTKSAAQLARELKPVWTKHSGRHCPCDQCVRDLHAASGVGPLPRGASMVRTVRATGDVQRLCRAHGEALKAVDQPPKQRGGKRR
jgi:hypothetical protein